MSWGKWIFAEGNGGSSFCSIIVKVTCIYVDKLAFQGSKSLLSPGMVHFFCPPWPVAHWQFHQQGHQELVEGERHLPQDPPRLCGMVIALPLAHSRPHLCIMGQWEIYSVHSVHSALSLESMMLGLRWKSCKEKEGAEERELEQLGQHS